MPPELALPSPVAKGIGGVEYSIVVLRKGLGAGWHLQSITVEPVGRDGEAYVFECNKWLDEKQLPEGGKG